MNPSGIPVPWWAFVIAAALGLGGILAIVVPTVLRRAPTPTCRTSDGMRVYAAHALDCDALSAYEHSVLGAFDAHVVGWSSDRMQSILAKFALQVVPTDGGTFENYAGQKVYGQTYLEMAVMQAAEPPLSVVGEPLWRQSAVAHEMAHVFEGYLDRREPDYAHASWESRGIYPALWEIER